MLCFVAAANHQPQLKKRTELKKTTVEQHHYTKNKTQKVRKNKKLVYNHETATAGDIDG